MTTFEDYITTTVTAVSAAVAFTVLINEAISGIYALNAAMLDEVKQQQVAQRRWSHVLMCLSMISTNHNHQIGLNQPPLLLIRRLWFS